MSEPADTQPSDAALGLRDWRREGLWRVDPCRFAQLEALAARLPQQPPALRQRLQARLDAALADYAQRIARAQQAAADEAARLAQAQPALARALRPLQALGDLRGLRRLAARSAPRTAEPLAALNRHLQAVSPTVQAAPASEVQAGREELASVRAFRRVWGRRQTVDRLAQARLRQPAKAGPLNSHVLVLQALAQMQELSPDYLRHCLAHVEALQWLEQAAAAVPPASPSAPAAKALKAVKAAKAQRARKA